MKNSNLEWLFCKLIQFWVLHIGILNPGPLDTGHFGNHKDSKVQLKPIHTTQPSILQKAKITIVQTFLHQVSCVNMSLC